jgi:hypothetical protein
MSDESLEIVRRSIDAFNWGDLEGVLETTPRSSRCAPRVGSERVLADGEPRGVPRRA